MKKKIIYAKFCPKCKGMDIRIDYRGGWTAWGVPPIYVCKDCGFTSYVFPEIKIKEKNGREAKEEKNEKCKST